MGKMELEGDVLCDSCEREGVEKEEEKEREDSWKTENLKMSKVSEKEKHKDKAKSIRKKEWSNQTPTTHPKKECPYVKLQSLTQSIQK